MSDLFRSVATRETRRSVAIGDTRRPVPLGGRPPTAEPAQVVTDFYGSTTCVTGKPRSWKNVLSIGDSDAERLALQDVMWWRVQRGNGGRWKMCRCKSVKLKQEPSVTELSAQLLQLAQLLPTCVQHNDDLDLMFDDDAANLAHQKVECPV